jgi:hypothetical protein
MGCTTRPVSKKIKKKWGTRSESRCEHIFSQSSCRRGRDVSPGPQVLCAGPVWQEFSVGRSRRATAELLPRDEARMHPGA